MRRDHLKDGIREDAIHDQSFIRNILSRLVIVLAPIALVAGIMAVGFVLVTDQSASEPSVSTNPSRPMESATDEPLPPGAEDHSDENDAMREMVAEPFPTFGGHYVDAERGTHHIQVTESASTSDLASLHEVLLQNEGDEFDEYRVVEEIVEFPWRVLHDAQQVVRATGGAGLTLIGIDERANSLKVGIDPEHDGSTPERIEQALEEAGIPTDAVEFEDSEADTPGPG